MTQFENLNLLASSLRTQGTITPRWLLARVRGFALEIADFEIFYLAKYLICNERRLRFQSKTAVVKTYPIPKPDVMRVDSSHHVSAPHRAKEERQVAPLLERGGEQAPR